MSTVNYAETLQKLRSIGADPVMVENRIMSANMKLIVLDRSLARLTAQLYRAGSGLGIADRACLATAKTIGAIALTADQAWIRYAPALGVEVELIRAA